MSHPGLTNQLPDKLPHKCSQIINNNDKMRMRPTPLHNVLGVSSSNAVACSSCVVVCGVSQGPQEGHNIYPLQCTPAVHSVMVQSEHRGIRDNANRAPIVSGLGSNPHLQIFKNGKWSMVFCKHVAIFTSDGVFFFRCWREMRLLCSPGASLPFLSHWGLYGNAICGASERAVQLPAPLRQELTAETSEQAGGQDSPLSDGCFLLALIDQRQSPPAVCHILTKWITDKSVGGNCSGDLTTSLRPQHSQMTSACLCITSPQLRVQAAF